MSDAVGLELKSGPVGLELKSGPGRVWTMALNLRSINMRSISKIVRSSLRLINGYRSSSETRPAPKPAVRLSSPRDTLSGLSGAYPGDFTGMAALKYAPSPDGNPDPGEVVWTWVPFEEDHTRGKDRPVLLVGNHGQYLLGVMLTSKDHGKGHRHGDDYVDVGTGSWDRQGRPSEAKLDRVLRINPQDIRREGAIIDVGPFNLVAEGIRLRHGWA